MAKFYQHLEPNELMGKVTKLRYVDDINEDDNIVYYYFVDGTKCNSEFIGEINDMAAVEKKKIMAEVIDPYNIWKLKKTEIKIEDKVKTAKNANGDIVEIPNLGVSVIRGENGYIEDLSKSKNGCIRIDSIPPKPTNKKVEDIENYLLSLHPELENSEIKEEVPEEMSIFKNKNRPTFTTTLKKPIKEEYPIKESEENKAKELNDNPITTNVIETIKRADINININKIIDGQYNNIIIEKDEKKIMLSIDEFIDKIFAEKPKEEEKPIQKTEFYDTSDEDVLITNMIEKSKKNECTIGIDFVMDLPPKEVYSTIKMVYPEGMTAQFVNSLAQRTPYDMLKEALKYGLSAYYEDELENK